MPLFSLNDKIWFPLVTEALPDGLLAIGGDLSQERLLLAYKKGIFPWYEGDVPLWWSPDPRFVMFPDEVKVSKSMRSILRGNTLTFTINKAFKEVINCCRKIERKDQEGTWINKDVEAAYTELHDAGYAHSAEAWSEGKLVAGLYGVRLGNVFFGESMFTTVSNGSKYAFIKYVQLLKKQGIKIIDCQVYTEHLESLGARFIKRDEFMTFLKPVNTGELKH
ncbi:MAG TPA: leucyl/phenylalanyl-tRNA--protein transferase [Segetibacter sp.]|jgi:leucyl/phenylalanyl-tRNA--protein transferase